MTISRGIAATVLVALLSACSGSGEGVTAQSSVTAIAVTPSATTTPVAAAVSPSATPVVTKTVTVRATPTPTKKAPAPAPVPAKTFCPLTAAKLTSLTKTPFERIGIGPEEALEEPAGVKATGCTFASNGPNATTITFLTGYGKNGDKLWAYVPTTCKGLGGSIITLGISIKNCTVAEAVRRSVVHRDDSVVWIDFNLPDEGAPKLADTFSSVVNATLNG
jgi:F0F1-type ATP synthase membrane subunit c/vacuolar-type H+-ATPase subunit K